MVQIIQSLLPVQNQPDRCEYRSTSQYSWFLLQIWKRLHELTMAGLKKKKNGEKRWNMHKVKVVVSFSLWSLKPAAVLQQGHVCKYRWSLLAKYKLCDRWFHSRWSAKTICSHVNGIFWAQMCSGLQGWMPWSESHFVCGCRSVWKNRTNGSELFGIAVHKLRINVISHIHPTLPLTVSLFSDWTHWETIPYLQGFPDAAAHPVLLSLKPNNLTWQGLKTCFYSV